MIITYLINKHAPKDFFAELKGCNIAVTCVDLSKTWHITVDDQLHLIDSTPEKIDVQISGNIATFIQYVLYSDRTGLSITGNLGVAETLQKIFANIDVDWEAELAKYTGDVVSHQAFRHAKQLKDLDIDQMITEYLQEEAKILPTKYEVDEFMQKVDALRADVDRLTSKVQQYANNP